MSIVLAHERLRVYDSALGFAATASDLSRGWDRRHAVGDHLGRAAESVVLNLAEAARWRSGGRGSGPWNTQSDPLWSARHAWKQLDEGTIAIVLNIAEGNGRYSELDHRRFLEIAETSAVKIAALLDLALRRGLLNCTVWDPVKCQLGRILARLARM